MIRSDCLYIWDKYREKGIIRIRLYMGARIEHEVWDGRERE